MRICAENDLNLLKSRYSPHNRRNCFESAKIQSKIPKKGPSSISMILYSFNVAQSKVRFARKKPVEHLRHPGILGRFRPCKQTPNPIEFDFDIEWYIHISRRVVT